MDRSGQLSFGVGGGLEDGAGEEHSGRAARSCREQDKTAGCASGRAPPAKPRFGVKSACGEHKAKWGLFKLQHCSKTWGSEPCRQFASWL